ncbi:Biopolymer transport protein ExbD/TolR [Desulfonatronospira thiodismutans ASO3-1]|uniref:Biopolymer transport protein ExbD/TolR n=2 Tax=Desulfonatronospira TaxID=488937 RepID=D6SRE3_9BACT|nr:MULTISPECIES: ExbD/TolR family protein [Desulfonatronospira]EFI33259.1 Biopolymer transport protein ExbD/TolR [Desulfonatronospira thiodismutans ASO3-1]RQD76152.1 MAG: ExbD/TolR family protein [Desulfonatronospira sp. MSAO_Bac3]
MDFDPLGKGYISQTNVTPIVDVMLVLLIIFMITAPMLSQGLEVELPRTTMVETLPHDEDTLVVHVDKEGVIYLDEYEVELNELAGHLQRMIEERDRPVYLRADQDVHYGLVVRIMSAVREAGVERLGVLAELDTD